MSLRYESSGGIAVITLDRPEVLNAFDDDMGAAASDAITEAAGDGDVRCIVITGAGRAFSAGEDLGALADGYERGESPDLGDTLLRRYNPLIRAISSAPKPVLAAVNGVAAGAGASIVLACDHRIAADSAKLVLAFVKVGLVPDAGALWFLARAIGTARAYRAAATGDPIDAATALEWGLYDEVVPGDELEATWRAEAERLAAGPTRAYALMKGLLREATSSTLDAQLEREVTAQTRAGRSSDHMEGVNAFLSKRAPRFEGR